jgi:tRNA-dihydrouridine synthase 1
MYVADRPLILQLAGDDPETMCEAALLAESTGLFDAIDINLGCPQERAKEGHYGAYLCGKDDWDLVADIVSLMSNKLTIPLFCKIRYSCSTPCIICHFCKADDRCCQAIIVVTCRLLDSLPDTLRFAQMLEACGCALIAVHGRKRGSTAHRRAGAADMLAIKAVKEALSIPVIANGNIRFHADTHANLVASCCDGLMSGEGPLLLFGF